MCEAKPGTRCAGDTREAATATMTTYAQTSPGGPVVDPISAASLPFEAARGAAQWRRYGEENLDPQVKELFAAYDDYENTASVAEVDEMELLDLHDRARRLGGPVRKSAAEIDGVQVISQPRYYDDEGNGLAAEHKLTFPDGHTANVYQGTTSSSQGRWHSAGPAGFQSRPSRDEAIAAQVGHWKATQAWPHTDIASDGEAPNDDPDLIHHPRMSRDGSREGHWWVRQPASGTLAKSRRYVTRPDATTWAVERDGTVWRKNEHGDVENGDDHLTATDRAQMVRAALSDPYFRK